MVFVLVQGVFVLVKGVLVLVEVVLVLVYRVFVLVHGVFVLVYGVLSLRSSFWGLRFRNTRILILCPLSSGETIAPLKCNGFLTQFH